MKYSLQDMPPLAITILLTAVFFVVGIVILSAIGDNSNFTYTNTATNESVTVPTLGENVSLLKGYTLAISSITNTTGTTFPSGNYSLSNTGVSSGGVVQFLWNATVCKTGQSCLVTYTYTDHTNAAGTVVTNATTALSEIPNNWLLLIMTVLGASLVIGIVMSNMGKFTNGRE